MNFLKRSYEKELLDGNDIPFDDIKKNMQELNFINEWLGGHAITIKGFKNLAGCQKNITVCELGCGGGDNLLAVYKWSRSKNINVSLVGIDIKEECIDFAKTRAELTGVAEWITSDYRTVSFVDNPDIIFSSLFCHHFTDDELTEQLRWMKENSRIGFFINDLQRNALAYYSIKTLTKLFSSSYLVKNDAPLSVARGFIKSEWQKLCEQAEVENAIIKWKWAFRFLIIYKK